jgi:peptidoglycan hydrolase-like protein with peptidoglycan-binding domain
VLNRRGAEISDRAPYARIIALDLGRLGLALLDLFARRPADSIGALAMAIAATAILVNAVFLQPRPHPAPIFAPRVRPVVITRDATGAVTPTIPRPRPVVEGQAAEPVSATRARTQIVTDIQRELSRRGFYDGPTDGVHGARTDAAIRDFAQLAGLKLNMEAPETVYRSIMQSPLKATATAKPTSPQHAASPRQNDPIAALLAPSKRVLAVQRALADYGYGQMVPTGLFDPATKAAIERFERERKLPVTGQVSDRLVRELAATTGRPLE